MDVIFDKSFLKSLDKWDDKVIKKKIEKVIVEAEAAKFISDISNIKKLRGYKTYYCIRIGEYRIGIELDARSVLRFIIALHRKDIYKKFP